jgi:hemolysin activation/secretion protein
LPSGNYIENTSLERTMLILNDQPGIKVRPILRPGSKPVMAIWMWWWKEPAGLMA